jgi:hypothetical protein
VTEIIGRERERERKAECLAGEGKAKQNLL